MPPFFPSDHQQSFDISPDNIFSPSSLGKILLSLLPCRDSTQVVSTLVDSYSNPLRVPVRRGLNSPPGNPLIITLVIVLAVIVFPSICLYVLHFHARQKRARKRQRLEAACRQRLELQRDIEQMEHDFMIPGSSWEPLPPYLPRPPSYTSEGHATPSPHTGSDPNVAVPPEVKITAPAPARLADGVYSHDLLLHSSSTGNSSLPSVTVRT